MRESRRERVRVGVDVGASLVKLAVDRGPAGLQHALFSASEAGRAAAAIGELGPGAVGLTGCGARALAGRLDRPCVRVDEFAAWGAGAARLLAHQGLPSAGRHLLVSVGTGTSVLRVDGMSISRIGGTALGGGTLMGLGALVLGESDFGRLVELARRGDRGRVDLRVSDIYQPGEIALTGDLTAASFGKLAAGEAAFEPTDLAHALLGLIGENVALVCAGLARTHQVERVVFAGTTLRENPVLREVIRDVSVALGQQPVFLEKGEFTGAVGALALAEDG